MTKSARGEAPPQGDEQAEHCVETVLVRIPRRGEAGLLRAPSRRLAKRMTANEAAAEVATSLQSSGR